MISLNNAKPAPTLDDLIGIGHCKIGFYKALQHKVEELEQANQELLINRKKMQLILDGITDLMLVLSEDYIIQQTNHVAAEWYPDTDVIGSPCYQILRKRTTPCPECPVQLAITEQRIVKDLCSFTIDSHLKYYEMIASPMPKDSNGLRRVLLFKRDVTLEKRYQVKYAQSEKMATVGTLAAGIAHEINNPLTSISGFAQGLQRRVNKLVGRVEDELVADFDEYTETIITECLRCRDIVKTLLTFSRPLESTRSIVRLNQCVGDILFILQHHLKDQQNISVKTTLDPNLPVILGDESQLKQVIINLVINAFDAMKDGGEIEIITRKGMDNTVKLIFKDTGSGIAEEILEKIFDPFFTTKQVGQGTGIGLSTCYGIVSNHQGTITALNNQEKGASFTVLLPEAIL
ncbi:two-component system sensor histidine kinase NtrB [Desulfotalea psychrophila]|nr:ATP-binding protein [Desulfotalea psychrophila]